MSVFDCSICLDSVQDPVVTLCGHLFCRPCLDKWLQFHSHRLECPVCKAPVDEDKLVPIYGKGSDLLPDMPSQQTQTAPAPPELPPELTYVRQDRSCGLFCKRLFGALSSVWNLLFGVVSSVWNILVIVMSSIWNLLVSVISSIWNALVIVMSSVWNLLLDVIRFVWYTLAYTECLQIPPHAQRNPLAYLTICFIGFFLLYKRVSSWLS